MTYQHLVIEETADHIKTIFLNRPERLNALNRGIMQELITAAEALHEDDKSRVVIIASKGKHFSAGADIKELSKNAEASDSYLLQRRRAGLGAKLIRALLNIPQITIAAINGVALGGGACIANACDFRIGSDDCRVGYPEIDLGMNLMWQALPLCVALVGPAKAKRLVIGGQHENAFDLLQWGFLDEVVKLDELHAAALTMAKLYASKPPIAAQMIKASVNAISGALDQALMHMDTDQNLLTAKTQDRLEGMRAFLEKRDAEFTGN